MCGGSDPRRAIDVQAKVVVAAQDGCSGMQPHPDPQPDTGWPSRCRQLAICLNGCRHCALRIWKNRGRRSRPLGADDRSTALGDCCTDDRACRSCTSWYCSPNCSSSLVVALHVCEEESDGACRKACHEPLSRVVLSRRGRLACPAVAAALDRSATPGSSAALNGVMGSVFL